MFESLSGCERDRAVNFWWLLTRDKENIGRSFRGTNETFKVTTGPRRRLHKPETPSADESPQIPLGHTEIEKRRELTPPAFPVNCSVGEFRCQMKSSANATRTYSPNVN